MAFIISEEFIKKAIINSA